MATTSASFDDAIRVIRLAAAAADPLPHGLPFNKTERGACLALMPRRSFSFPVPGNPRGITVSAVDHRETLEALADKLETKARAFGGKPPAKVRKKSRTSGYQAARSAFAEGHHRQVLRALGDRLAFVVGKNGSIYPVMVVEEFERVGHTWAIVWPVSGKTRTPALAHVTTGTYGSISPAHGDIMSKEDEFFERLASGAPATAPALDQTAALDSFIADDRVESLDADAIAESEPCDVADAQVAHENKTADDAAIHSGEDAPTPLAEPVDRHPIPDFASAREADAWWRDRAKSFPTQSAYRATPEYSEFVRKTTPLYARDKAIASSSMAEAMKAAGVAPGARVATTQAGSYLNTMTLTGTVVMRGGIPWVALDEKIYTSRKGRVSEASRVRWSPAWKPIQEAESTDPERNRASHAPTASPSAPAPAPVAVAVADSHASAAPLLPRPHQKLAQVPDQKATHAAGSSMASTTNNSRRTDNVPVGTHQTSRQPIHRTRWSPRRTEDARFNPLQAEPIQNNNAMRRREPWDSVAADPPRTRPGSMPPIRAVSTGAPDFLRPHRSIKGRYLIMPRKLHKPPDQKATRAAGSCRPRRAFTLSRRNLTSSASRAA